MKDKLLSIDKTLLGLARFSIMLFLIALVLGVGFFLFVLSLFSGSPIMWLFMGGFTNTWYLFPLGIFSIYLFRIWLEIGSKIIKMITPE